MELSYKDTYYFESQYDIVHDSTAFEIVKKVYAEEFATYKDLDEDEIDEEVWENFLSDIDMGEILARIGAELCKKVLCGLYEYGYQEMEDRYYLNVMGLCCITEQDIKELVEIYQQENNLPDMPEPVVDVLLQDEN